MDLSVSLSMAGDEDGSPPRKEAKTHEHVRLGQRKCQGRRDVAEDTVGSYFVGLGVD